MRKVILSQTRFKASAAGWELPSSADSGFQCGAEGALLSPPPGRGVSLTGAGVHTRNGDAIEAHFRPLEPGKGRLQFGFSGGMESAMVTLDFERRKASLSTSDWTCPQPVARADFKFLKEDIHVLRIEKAEGGGGLVRNADIRVFLDGEGILSADGVNILPEIGVKLGAADTRVLIRRFVHRGVASGIPEYLHVGGWQMLNRDAIEDNVQSLFRGLDAAAERGVQLLVTPETSLTGLFPTRPVTQQPAPIAEAEVRLRQYIRGLTNAPYVVVGLPVWERVPGHRREETRYNVCRVYDPDGEIVCTHAKIHSCET